LYVDGIEFEISNFTRELTEDEIIRIMDFLGMNFYYSNIDLGYVNYFTNDESYYLEEEYNRRPTQ
jgi:hypothetical protein